jgi:hypothetical protein
MIKVAGQNPDILHKSHLRKSRLCENRPPSLLVIVVRDKANRNFGIVSHGDCSRIKAGKIRLSTEKQDSATVVCELPKTPNRGSDTLNLRI